MDEENKKEDKRLLKLFCVVENPENFSDGLGITKERLKKITREIRAVDILHDEYCNAMVQVSKMYNDPQELAFALFIMGKLSGLKESPITGLMKAIFDRDGDSPKGGGFN